MKLNWMARKLKAINDPATIKEWTEAMHSVYRVLEDFSRNEDLSSPPPINRKKWEFHRVKGISVTPSDKEANDFWSTKAKIQRPVMKGVRSLSLKMVSRGVKTKKKLLERVQVRVEQPVDHVGTEEGVSMEVVGHFSQPDNERHGANETEANRKFANLRTN